MKILIILAVICLNNTVFGQNKEFFDALGFIESANNAKAVGDNGKAIGIYQIHEVYFKDARDFDKSLSKYSYNDCFRPEIARKVVSAYLSRYCKNGSMEDMARCHNSGPKWISKTNLTENYVKRFRLALKRG